MEKNKKNQYKPNIAIPPGNTLLEVIDSLKMTQKELATRMDRPIKTINEIIKGKAAITPETAGQLERVLNIEASFWNNLECNFRETQYRILEQKKIAEQEQWAKNFPLREMRKYGWLDDSQESDVEAIFSYFGVADPQAWNNMWNQVQSAFPYRKSNTRAINVFSLASWLRRGEILAKEKQARDFNRKLLVESLSDLKEMSRKPMKYLQKEGTNLLAMAGVKLVFVHELPNMPVHGVTRAMNDGSILIQLSLRYKTNDQVWFSLFHELGHVLLHKKYDFTYMGKSQAEKNIMEKEANDFASDFFIEPVAYDDFIHGTVNVDTITEFAKKLKIAPGIVVGRWQHDNNNFIRFNRLKIKVQWAY